MSRSGACECIDDGDYRTLALGPLLLLLLATGSCGRLVHETMLIFVVIDFLGAGCALTILSDRVDRLKERSARRTLSAKMAVGPD